MLKNFFFSERRFFSKIVYEKLIENPYSQLNVLTERLQIPISLNANSIVTTKTSNRYLAYPWATKEIEGQLGQLAIQFGYTLLHPSFQKKMASKFSVVRDKINRRIHKKKLVN